MKWLTWSKTVVFAVLSIIIVAALRQTAWADDERLSDAPQSVQGGWNYTRWLEEARTFAETLMQTAPDRYGARNTPLWVAAIDPDTGGLVEKKPPNWQSYWDAEDYVMTAQGCNLYRDMPTVAGFYDLSRIADTTRYRDAADDYLRFWLRECPSPATGLFPWGEHMSYNCVRDTLNATRHEMEYNLPEWELLWKLNPGAVQREIEAIYRIHIWDKDKFLYDRHGNYYTGEFDPLPVRGTYIKHSGLYTHSFLFLYTKTGDAKHLEWARKMSDLYWQYRHPKTNLIPGYVSSSGGSGNCDMQPLLAYYLLEAVKRYPDPYIRERATGMLDAFLKYGFKSETGEFAGELVPATGAVTKWSTTTWGAGESAGYYGAMACWDAYELTKDERYLKVLEARLKNTANTPLSDKITPVVAGGWLKLYVRAYRATRDDTYVAYARRLAEWSREHLTKRGLIIESASGYVYLNYSRPGELMQAWLELYEAERERPVHWLAPESVALNQGALAVLAQGDSLPDTLSLVWQFQDGKKGAANASRVGGQFLFSVPVLADAAQGPMSLMFVEPSTQKTLDKGTVLVADNPKGPSISEIRFPAYVDRAAPLEGDVKVVDASGVGDVKCAYAFDRDHAGTTPCRKDEKESSLYHFTIPAAGEVATSELSFRIEAQGNPKWPVVAKSAEQRAAVATGAALKLSAKVGESATLAASGDIEAEAVVKPARLLENGILRVERIPVNLHAEKRGLPQEALPGVVEITPDDVLRAAGGELAVRLKYDPKQAEAILPSTLTAYRLQGDAWQKVAGTSVDASLHALSIPCAEGGAFVIGGIPRLAARRTFNGALLSCPAAARISKDGTLAIILDTRNPDGVLYALNAKAETLWTYDAGGAQPFPAVADLDGDGLDEIAVGGAALSLLGHDGKVLWKADLPGASSPVIGDLRGDGHQCVVAATSEGTVAAFSDQGQPLWRVNDLCSHLKIPALGHLGADKKLSVVAGGDDHVVAISADGKTLWDARVEGAVLYAPALGDLDGDGRDDVVVFSRNDTKGALTAVGSDGHVLWSAQVSRESDWCPVIADLDGTDEPRIVAQAPDPKKLLVFDRKGALVREINTTGRLLQTPVPLDLDGDGKLDLLLDSDLSYRMWALGNDGAPLWSYTPHSLTLPGAKIKGGGSLLVADVDGDGRLEVVGGDDETWLNIVRTETPCKPWAVVSGQFHGDSRHTGNYMKR
ncbi:MAG: PQQ-binding-like beta-propeller repeat protein [Candidatus Hydrogenedentes bacterium]|nr:PQQ-binding-like beta-propeller repeat protein [Candidatus Hydrogenedentota bacterium]